MDDPKGSSLLANRQAQGSIERRPLETGDEATSPVSEEGLEVRAFGRRRSNAASVAGEGREGKARGVQLRLVTFARSLGESREGCWDRGESFEGRKRAVGTRPRKPSKHREPHGWQRVATHAQDLRGENRQDGGKPWRRNEKVRWLRVFRSGRSDARAGVDSRVAYGGGAIFGNPRRGIRRARKVCSEAEMVNRQVM